MSSPASLIRLTDYCFAYDELPVLCHLNLAIAQGEARVLRGDNGSGKSTLLKALSGLIFPAQGSYEFDGERVSEASMRDPAFAKRLHARVGYVFQDSDAQLFCPSVQAELAFGPRQMGLSEGAVQARVDDVLGLLGIADLRDRAPYTLSGGEKRKVAIACVLTMNPDVLCLDEPLAGLDARTRAWLVGFLGACKAAGKTLVVATHDQSLAEEIADGYVDL